MGKEPDTGGTAAEVTGGQLVGQRLGPRATGFANPRAL